MEQCYVISFWNGEYHEDFREDNLYVVFDEETAKTHVEQLNKEYAIKWTRYNELRIVRHCNLSDSQLLEYEKLLDELRYNEDGAIYRYEVMNICKTVEEFKSIALNERKK